MIILKICHVTSLHKRYDNRIFEKQCKSLSSAGFKVILIVNDEMSDENIDEISIFSTSKEYKNRIQNLLFSTRRLLQKAIEVDADIYHLHDPNLIFLGNKLRMKGKKVIFDSHESVPDQIREKEWIPKYIRYPISYFYSVFERLYLKKFSGVISVSPQIVDRLRKINSNAIMITNYPKIKNVKIIRYPNKSICFAGTINSEWNHLEILDAIEEIEDLTYYLAGPADPEYLKQLKKHTAWRKVKYLGVISHKEVQELYSISCIGMAINSSKQIQGIGTLGNTKIFEFMEAGLPIVCTDYVLWKEILDKYQCGIYVNPKSIEEIRKSILYFLNNKNKALIMGANGRKAIEDKYNWDSQKKILIDFYKKTLEV